MLRMISFSLFVQGDQYERYRASLYSHVGQPPPPHAAAAAAGGGGCISAAAAGAAPPAPAPGGAAAAVAAAAAVPSSAAGGAHAGIVPGGVPGPGMSYDGGVAAMVE